MLPQMLSQQMRFKADKTEQTPVMLTFLSRLTFPQITQELAIVMGKILPGRTQGSPGAVPALRESVFQKVQETA
ncbi:MAG TPA: hypothetical protein VE954_03365 [Oligoflexus sp.]|uniref:hypothetical protein n=1 Tax=Oligoflexus sp. TaxID=1971216 RepID=UPI002D4A666D|nr:hypothetical protein [Oligoflexus sp.]HYX32126.1 hypothetical protein [Oligoflexus sp.]